MWVMDGIQGSLMSSEFSDSVLGYVKKHQEMVGMHLSSPLLC